MPAIVYSAEVAHARATNQPIVALESTILAHGFPFPENAALATALEAQVRAEGAVPATIAVVAGQIHVGLDEATLAHVCANGANYRKIGATEIGITCARKGNAATTVSATTAIAARVGISVFATGGIGGVHRGDAGDVSHDLVAMAAHPVAVVSAGAKAILDLPRTLETLETLGVLVLGYRCDEFPAFYTAQSGLALAERVDTTAELAAIARAHWAVCTRGILVCNPIPLEAALPTDEVRRGVTEALDAAAAAHVTGKALTPFLLRQLASVTGGRSVTANRALALHNARVGAQLARALAFSAPST